MFYKPKTSHKLLFPTISFALVGSLLHSNKINCSQIMFMMPLDALFYFDYLLSQNAKKSRKYGTFQKQMTGIGTPVFTYYIPRFLLFFCLQLCIIYRFFTLCVFFQYHFSITKIPPANSDWWYLLLIQISVFPKKIALFYCEY